MRTSLTPRPYQQRPRPERGADAPRESERGWGPASTDRSGQTAPLQHFLGLCLAIFQITSSLHAQSSAPRRILFIGNSLTAANDLPAIVTSLARARGETIETTAVTTNNFSLEDHWNQGPARSAIARGGWSVVVLQQGPSALPESRVLLRTYAKRFADEAGKVGARTALYMVWPSQSRARDFPAVSVSYALAARDVGGILLPAGDTWRGAWQRQPSLALYAGDGLHPSALGSYLAALAIWRVLFEQSTIGLPGPPGVPAETIKLLQDAADQINVRASAPKEFAALR